MGEGNSELSMPFLMFSDLGNIQTQGILSINSLICTASSFLFPRFL